MAMVKIIDPSGWDFDRPVAQLVKVSGQGLVGQDRSDFIKIASPVFLDLIDNIKLAKDEVPVHVISHGSSEAYGPNRNGDGFKEATCRAHVHTFEKFARWYRNHENKDPSKSYGTVKKAAYNEDMRRVEILAVLNASKEAAARNGGFVADRELNRIKRGEDLPVSMACVSDPEYPVLTRDRGYVGIAAIRVGDMVWTHEGRWRKVTQLNRRRYTGELLTFQMNGLPLPVELTADHPMWAKVFEGSREAAAVKTKASRYFKDAEAFNKTPAGWMHAEHVGVGDRFFYRPITRYNGYGRVADTDLAAIMGYYLAEGSFGYNGDKACTTQFNCNMDDSLPRRLPGIIERMFPDVTVDIRPRRGSEPAIVVELYNTDFSEFLRRYVGRGCKHKQISPELFNAEEDVKLSFLGAWLDGDGWLDKKGSHWSTSSQNLALQGRDLLASIGVPSSIYKIDHEKCETSGKPGSGVEYTLNISHIDAWRLGPWSTKAADYPTPSLKRTKPATMRSCPDGTYAYRVKAVDRRYAEDVQTYNFEVEEDESYSLGGLISHNCRVPYDVCSGCGNKAKTRADYCDADTCEKYGGCKSNLTKVAEDGHILHVDNPDPVWFDISDVFRPADRIAYGGKADYLQKAASHGFMPGAELADALGVTAPIDVVMASDISQISNPTAQAQVKLAHGLARMEEMAVTETQVKMALDREVMPDLTDDQLRRIGTPGTKRAAEGLGALADRQIFLSVSDFARWVGKEAMSSDAERLAPKIYNDLVNSGNIDQQLAASPFNCNHNKAASGEQKSLARGLEPTHSMNMEAIQARAMRASLRNINPATKQASDQVVPGHISAETRQLARAYGLYKLAALQRVASFDTNFNLTVRLALAQNGV